MGFRVTLIAVTGKDPATIHREFAVEPTGTFVDFPDAPVAGAQVPAGPYVLYINDGILPSDALLARLSQDASLMTCTVNETVMCSDVCAWSQGIEQWTVTHDCQFGINHLETSGEVPRPFHEIRERLCGLQASSTDVDYVFDVPVELFVAMGGIRYDQDIPEADPNPWQVLTRIKPSQPKSRWWPFG